MSDMQKVRVRLTDADGKVHGVVGWGYPGNEVVKSHPEWIDNNYWYMEIGSAVEVTPIQELPTGLGAVVEVQWDDPEGPLTTERYVRIGDATWFTPEVGEDVSDKFLNAQKFTVLSEGVK